MYFLYFVLSFFDLCIPTPCRCEGSLLHLFTLIDTHTHARTRARGGSTPLARDRPVAQTPTLQQTTLTRDRWPYPRWDSNPQSQQARPTLDSAATGIGMSFFCDVYFVPAVCASARPSRLCEV